MIDDVTSLRRAIPQEEFDYQILLDALRDYAYPRDKISSLLARGVLVRVKKGLYIFADPYRTGPYSREILANLIYGPSCISLEYALYYHGLIPECSVAVTSVTPKRAKQFRTPVGLFLYKNIPEAGFHVGLQRVEMASGRAFLLASPEKALADKFRGDRRLNIRSQKESLHYLVNSLRIDEYTLATLDGDLLESLANSYHSRRIRLLASLVRTLKSGQES